MTGDASSVYAPPMEHPRLAIFLRFPTPGEAKTRLIPAVGEEGAALVHRRLAEQTLATARESGLAVELRVTGAPASEFRRWLGNGYPIVDQGEGDLGDRLQRVPAPSIVIGSDAPELTASLLVAAAESLAEHEVVIGPASDGGYYLIGFRQPVPYLFAGIEWSTPRVLPETLERLRDRGISPALLPELSDVDLPSDLARWPELSRE